MATTTSLLSPLNRCVVLNIIQLQNVTPSPTALQTDSKNFAECRSIMVVVPVVFHDDITHPPSRTYSVGKRCRTPSKSRRRGRLRLAQFHRNTNHRVAPGFDNQHLLNRQDRHSWTTKGCSKARIEPSSHRSLHHHWSDIQSFVLHPQATSSGAQRQLHCGRTISLAHANAALPDTFPNSNLNNVGSTAPHHSTQGEK